MRAVWVASVLGMAALILGASTGCGGDPADQTDLAKLPLPSDAAVAKAKATRLTGARPKFGAPPKNERAPTTSLP